MIDNQKIVNFKDNIQSVVDDKEFETTLQEYMDREIEKASPTARIICHIRTFIHTDKTDCCYINMFANDDSFKYVICNDNPISNITNLKEGWEYLLHKLDEFGLQFNVKSRDLPDDWDWDLTKLEEVGHYQISILIYLNV